MDINTLIDEAKARFNHNSAKEYLKEKYTNKLIVADQGGLWTADIQTINFLTSVKTETCILVDNFGNPVKVNSKALSDKLSETYRFVLEQWYDEWQELEKKR